MDDIDDVDPAYSFTRAEIEEMFANAAPPTDDDIETITSDGRVLRTAQDFIEVFGAENVTVVRLPVEDFG
jgi:hypothetical protein